MESAMVQRRAPEAVVEHWIAAYEGAVVQTCFVMLRDRALAEDAAQDTFLKAWKRYGQFEGRDESSEKTWIMRIAINTCKDYKRSLWIRRVDLKREIDQLPQTENQPGDQEQKVFEAILRLPDKLRAVILMYYYHNLTMAETAQALGLAVSSVHSRLNKARALLRGTLEGRESHE